MEQARADVEAWANETGFWAIDYQGDPAKGLPPAIDELVSRLTPVYERAQVADKLDEPICTLREYKAQRERAERAEAALRLAGVAPNDVPTLQWWATRCNDETAKLRVAEADVVRLREALRAVLRVADRKTDVFDAAHEALAATEPSK